MNIIHQVYTEERHAYFFPAVYLLIGVDAWDMWETSCVMRDEGGFCNEQGAWCRTALGVIGCLVRPRNMGGMRSETGQRGMNDTVLKC